MILRKEYSPMVLLRHVDLASSLDQYLEVILELYGRPNSEVNDVLLMLILRSSMGIEVLL